MVKVPNAGSQGKRNVNGKSVANCEILGPSIIDLVRAGMRPSKAGQAVGLSRQTVSHWINRGIAEQVRIEDGQDPLEEEEVYLNFTIDLAKAEAESQAGLVLAWFKEARQGDWKAAQAFLAKRFPDEWGDSNTLKLEVTGAGGGPIQAVHYVAEEDEKRKRAVLEALVESGDLPQNVLEAWDGTIEGEVVYDSEEPVGITPGLEKALRNQSSSQSTPETDSLPDMDDN